MAVDNCDTGTVTIAILPVTGSEIAGNDDEGWWQRTKRTYAQKWKIRDKSFSPQPARLGIGASTAALTANLMGLGITAMPLAFAGIGPRAAFVIPMIGALSAFNSVLLGWCCDILEERYEKFRKFHWYTQYTDIASEALGSRGRKLAVEHRLLGVVGLQAVLLVTIGEVAADLAGALSWPPGIKGMAYCGFLTTAGILYALFPEGNGTRYWTKIRRLPFHLALTALLIAGLVGSRAQLTSGRTTNRAKPSGIFTLSLDQWLHMTGGWAQTLTEHSVFRSLGIIAFNYANIAGFPLLRRDMAVPAAFSKAAVRSVAGNTISCLAVGAVAFSSFGVLVNGNIVHNLGSVMFRLPANFCLLAVCLSTALLNTVTLDEYESCNDYGKKFTWSRFKNGFPLMLLGGLLALAVPFKGPLIALVGAVGVCPVIYVLPPVFYFNLCRKSDQWPEKPQSILMKAALAVSVLFGLVVTIGGAAAAVAEIWWQSNAITLSCFRGFCYYEQFQLVPTPSIYRH